MWSKEIESFGIIQDENDGSMGLLGEYIKRRYGDGKDRSKQKYYS